MKRFLAAAMLFWSFPAMAYTFQDLWDYRFQRPPEGGVASVYDEPQPTASGEPFRPYNRKDPTCAIWDEPFGRRLKVCRADDPGRCTICRVNDRGPHPRLKRAIDLTPPGMEDLGCGGLCKEVTIERVLD